MAETEAEAFERAAQSDSAPDLRWRGPDGKETSLLSYGGRIVLLNLWATWCAPCIKEMPELSALHTMREHITVVGLAGIPDQGFFRRGDMRLYVTRCVGFYGYPMRVGIPPEIAVLTLRSQSSAVAL